MPDNITRIADATEKIASAFVPEPQPTATVLASFMLGFFETRNQSDDLKTAEGLYQDLEDAFRNFLDSHPPS